MVLEPLGYDLMFMGFTLPLKQGHAFPRKFNFEHEGSARVTFQVLGMGAQGPDRAKLTILGARLAALRLCP